MGSERTPNGKTPNRVPGEGPPNARIVIVGEAPGETEDREGRPFVGSSGRYLNRLLSDAGIDRASCYITNVVKTRPPSNNFGIYYADKSRKKPTEGLIQARKDLMEEIRAINPNVVIGLGAEALKALTGHDRISKYRGSVLWSEELGAKVVPTYHPAYLFRSAIDRPVAESDLRKALRHSTSPDHTPPNYEFALAPDYAEVLRWLAWIQAEKPTLTFDLETTREFSIRCVGISVDVESAICIPFTKSREAQIGPGQDGKIPLDTEGESYWTPAQEADLRARIQTVMEDPTIPKIAQNYAFDATVLAWQWRIHVRGLWLDTAHLWHALWPELPKNLDFLCSLYTDQPYYADHDRSVDREEWEYNCLDCCVTHQVAEALRREADELGMWEFYKEMVEPGMFALTRASNRGVRIAPEARETMKEATRDRKEGTRAELRELTGLPDFNPNSNPQVLELLYGESGLGLPRQLNRKTGNPSANVEALQVLQRKARTDREARILELLMEYRGAKKALEYYEARPDEDGRMRCSYDVSGTKNGRISSSQSIWGSGMNLQQCPKGKDKTFRKMFVPDPGFTLVKVDLSQAEARIVAWIAPIPELVERFQDPNFDIHTRNASWIFGKPEPEIGEAERAKGKIGTHACVTPDTEVLTPGGWVRFDAYNEDDPIAQWDPWTDESSFVEPLAVHRYDYEGPILHWKGTAIDLMTTPNHRMPYVTNGNLKEARADSLPTYQGRYPITALDPEGFPAKGWEVRLAVAIQADGSFAGKGYMVRWHLVKKRKKDRLVDILEEGGVPYQITRYNDGSWCVRIDRRDIPQVTLLLTAGKTFSWNILSLDGDARRVFLEELPYWDGTWTTDGRNRVEYFSSDPENLDVVQAVAAITGQQTLRRASRGLHVLSFNRRQFARYPRPETIQYEGSVYCVTVPSGGFLTRRNGTVTPSLNSNYGMGPKGAAVQFNIPYKEAERIIESVRHANSPHLQNWWEAIRSEVNSTRTLTTPRGRRRTFLGRLDESTYRSAYSFIPQAEVGDTILRALAWTEEVLAEEEGQVLLQVHDELVLQVRADRLTTALPKIRALMEPPLRIPDQPDLVIPSEIETGPNWADTELVQVELPQERKEPHAQTDE